MPLPAIAVSDFDPLGERWQAQPNDLIGGWCVTPARDNRTPSDGALVIADIASREAAEHIADLHNAWLLFRQGSA